MDINNLSWILLGALAVFALGWFSSQLDFLQMRFENRLSPKSYFKGLNLLLNEQEDEAIDAFIEAVQNDPDTSELHFALGRMFRARGEYGRAVRVHHHLLERGDLPLADRERAQHALAQDYLKAGILNYAEDALLKLDGSAFDGEAKLALMAIYERSRDWARAHTMAEKLCQDSACDASAAKTESSTKNPVVASEPLFGSNLRYRRVHYLCEQAAQLEEQDAAKSMAPDQLGLALQTQLQSAVALEPAHPRAHVQWLHFCIKSGMNAAALEYALDWGMANLEQLPLVCDDLVQLGQQNPSYCPQIMDLLYKSYQFRASIDVLHALATLDPQTAPARYAQHLQSHTALSVVQNYLRTQLPADSPVLGAVMPTLHRVTHPLLRYRCEHCGFETHTYFWQCPACLHWDSFPIRRIEEA